MTHATAPAAEDPIAAAWACVRFLVGVLINTFGSPSELLAIVLVPRVWRRDITAWLRPAETLVRRLTLIRAAELSKTLAPAAPSAPKRPFAPRRSERATPPEDSTKWRGIRFRLIPRAARKAFWREGARVEPLPKTPKPYDFFDELRAKEERIRREALKANAPASHDPHAKQDRAEHRGGSYRWLRQPATGLAFAERLEALIRAVHKPERLATRLARRLTRKPDPTIIARLVRPMPDNADNPARAAAFDLEAPLAEAAYAFHRRSSG